jgi:hypothetical protein
MGLVFLLSLFASATGALSDPLLSFLPPVSSTVAQNADLETFPVASVADCASACLANASCVSFNYVQAAPQALKTCGIAGDCYAPNASSCPSYMTLSCPQGTFTEVLFASYGLPVVGSNGPCDFSLPPGACNSPSAVGVFEQACVGKSTCTIDCTLSTFGEDPCQGTYKFIAAILKGVNCSSAPQPPPPMLCTLSSYSRGYALVGGTNASYYLRLQPRNDSALTPAVPYSAAPPPMRTVTLGSGNSSSSSSGGGLLAQGFDTNLAYLIHMVPGQASTDELLFPYRKRHDPSSNPPGHIFGWDGFVPGSVASAILMGTGQALKWTEAPALRAVLTTLLDGIIAAAEDSGYAVGYPEADTNAYMGGNNQLPSYVNSWFTHGLLDSAEVDPRALLVARKMNSWWNNCTFLPQLFPQDGGEDHVGPPAHGYDPARGITSQFPWPAGHMLYWLNQAGIGHSRMAMSAAGTQADVDFLVNLFQEDWWLDQLAARNKSAIYARKWYPDNYVRFFPLSVSLSHLSARCVCVCVCVPLPPPPHAHIPDVSPPPPPLLPTSAGNMRV